MKPSKLTKEQARAELDEILRRYGIGNPLEAKRAPGKVMRGIETLLKHWGW